MTGHRRFIMAVIIAAPAFISCQGAGDAASDTSPDETDTEAPQETAGDTTSDGFDSDAKEACLASISGEILLDGQTGMEAVVVLCIGLTCYTPELTNADGRWRFEPSLEDGEVCSRRDFETDPIHIEIAALENPEDFAPYAFVRRPTQEDISDDGEDDFDLNLGALSLYSLPRESATFDPETGASVSLFGLSFNLPASGIVKRVVEEDVPIDHEQEIRVFKAPQGEWKPPFADVALDVLYFISPRWAKLAEPGAALSIEAPAGWNDGDEGVMHLLGGYTSSFGDDSVRDRAAYIYRDSGGLCVNSDDHDDLEQVNDGLLADCGAVSTTGGRIVTPPIPRFTWIGISRQKRSQNPGPDQKRLNRAP